MILPASMRVFERGWLSANNILFTSTRETTLVDSGYVTHAAQTLALLGHALQGRRLDRVVNTHLHSDHCGGNAALRAAHACRIAIPASEAGKVRAWDEDALSYRATGQQCPRFTFDEAIRPGDRLVMGDLAWQALAAPGHDPHALLFWCEQEGILISGDALWQNGFGVIFPELAGEPGFIETGATLDLIAGLCARLDYLAADPLRNAENGVKVLLKFLLLERQALAPAEVEALFESVPLLVLAGERFLRRPPAELARWAVQSLEKAGAARWRDGVLVNAA